MNFHPPKARALVLVLLPALLIVGFAVMAFHSPQRGDFDESDPAFTDTKGFQKLGRAAPGDWLHSHPETRQTFKEYCQGENRLRLIEKNSIYILPIGQFSPEDSPDLELLRKFAECYFSLPVKLMPSKGLPEGEKRERSGFGGKWTQYRIDGFNKILLETEKGDDCLCILGVTMVDIYPNESWNFVFGQANLGGHGIFSFARFRPSFYDAQLKMDDNAKKLLLKRSLAVLAHETGHMMGITHCVDFKCLMCGSNSLAESDSRPIHLCPNCLKKLAWYIRFDARERYRKLAAFYNEVGMGDEAAWIRGRLERIGPKRD